MMTPNTTVQPFNFEIIDISNAYTLLCTLPERFVRCNEDGTPDADHLYEVVETLVEARGFDTALRLSLIQGEASYFSHAVQLGAICGWVRATPICTKRPHDGGAVGTSSPRGGDE